MYLNALSRIGGAPMLQIREGDLFMSKALTVPSKEAERMALPLCVHFTALTPPLCSLNVTVQKPLSIDQIFT